MKRLCAFLFLLILALSGCRPAQPAATSTPLPPAETPSPTPSPTHTPAHTPSHTPTTTPVPTLTPAPALAYTAALTFSQVLTDVTYCIAEGGVELKMDVYAPLEPGDPAPAIVFVHGGGWVAGDKSGTTGVYDLLALTQRGYLVASIDYRLAPQYRFPAQIQDVKCAIRSLRAHAAEYNIDPSRIGAWGGSAGGHLVALLGTSDPDEGWDVGEYLDQSSRVQVVVDLFGIFDLTQDCFVGDPERWVLPAVFGATDGAARILIDASPVTHISPDDPPFLILHGDKDPVVPLSQSQILHERLVASGVPSTLVVVRNGGHGFNAIGGPIDPPRAELRLIMVDFFDRYLK